VAYYKFLLQDLAQKKFKKTACLLLTAIYLKFKLVISLMQVCHLSYHYSQSARFLFKNIFFCYVFRFYSSVILINLERWV